LRSPVRSKQASPETAPFESAFSESPVHVVSIYSRASLPASQHQPQSNSIGVSMSG
jgi:hypothetical protein